jgi:DnaD/phage-associated family protein
VKTKRFTDENETKTAAEIDSSSTSSSLSSSDSVSEEGGVGGETESVFTAYEHNIGMLTPMIGDALKDAEATYGPVWVCAAIQEAVQHEGRSWAYCDSILKRWKREGFKARKSSKQIPEDVSEHNRRVIEELAK